MNGYFTQSGQIQSGAVKPWTQTDMLALSGFKVTGFECDGGRYTGGAALKEALGQYGVDLRKLSLVLGVFPDVAVKMAEVGESTGALQDMLNTVADFYDEEISTTMERFVTLVEPVLLVIMGIVIAGLLLALYMPLFQLSSVLAG